MKGAWGGKKSWDTLPLKTTDYNVEQNVNSSWQKLKFFEYQFCLLAAWDVMKVEIFCPLTMEPMEISGCDHRTRWAPQQQREKPLNHACRRPLMGVKGTVPRTDYIRFSILTIWNIILLFSWMDCLFWLLWSMQIGWTVSFNIGKLHHSWMDCLIDNFEPHISWMDCLF